MYIIVYILEFKSSIYYAYDMRESKALCNLAVQQAPLGAPFLGCEERMDMPELVWKRFIDLEARGLIRGARHMRKQALEPSSGALRASAPPKSLSRSSLVMRHGVGAPHP